jgi:hypothetical protein
MILNRFIFETVLFVVIFAFGVSEVTVAEQGPCKTGSITLSDFSAYKTDMTNDILYETDKIALRIMASGIKTWFIDGHGAVFGNKAKLGSTKTHQLALNRAKEVKSVLALAIDNHGGNSATFTFIPRSYGNMRPLATNETKKGRAMNRRVVLCPYATTPEPPPTKKLELDEAFSALYNSTTNPIDKCLIDKLRNKTIDHTFLEAKGITKWGNSRNTTSYGYIDNLLDLKEIMKIDLKKINRASYNKAIQSRFEEIFNEYRIDLIHGISWMNRLACNDPLNRRAFGRKYLRDQSNKKSSLYSCPAIKAYVDDAIPPYASIHNCAWP